MPVLFAYLPILGHRQLAQSAVGAYCAADEVLHQVHLANKCAAALTLMLTFVVEYLHFSLGSTDEVINAMDEGRRI